MKFIPTKVSSLVATTALKASKYTPQVLFGAGVVGLVGTAVLASQATLKLEGIITEAQQTARDIDNLDDDRVSPEDQVKAKAYLKVKTGVQIVKLYLPALAVAALSIAALTGSHRILTKRNAGLTAAYTAVSKGFREYRDRVIEAEGEQKDKEYRYGVQTEKVAVVDEATGKKTVVEKKFATGVGDYGRLYADHTTPRWTNRPDLNFVILRGIQTQANMNLRANGFVLLNDVYKELGFPLTTAGGTVGWVADSERGDNEIDFGIFDNDDEIKDYVYGRTDGEIWLDFNVDGPVLDLIDKVNDGKNR
jgi:hypothetical protein